MPTQHIGTTVDVALRGRMHRRRLTLSGSFEGTKIRRPVDRQAAEEEMLENR